MRFQTVDTGFVLCLDRGDKVIETLLSFASTHRIQSAVIANGVGAVKQTRLGFYHLSQKKYAERMVPDESELLSLSGNISWLGTKPIVHCHIVIGNTEFQALGGHLFEAEVAITAEIYLAKFSTKIERKFNESVGLNLLNLS